MPGEQILSTKLVGPEPHPAAVDRIAALDWVDTQIEAGGAVVLSTLAGSGRLEVLARWAERRTTAPTAWLRLDAWDDLARYARHLIASLQQVDDRIGAEVAGAVDAGLDSIRDVVLPTLAADVLEYDAPLNLVVHGVDRIEDPEAFGALLATQRYRPDNLRLVWLSDDDEPADFQTADGVTHVPHIDPDLLAFTVDDVQAMFAAGEVTASEGQAADLVATTGGWALPVLHLVDAARDAGRYIPYDPGDRTLAERIERMVVSGLPDDLQTLASDLSVVGPVTVRQLEAMTDRTAIADGLATLRNRHVVQQLPGTDRWTVVRPVRAHLAAQREVHDASSAVILRRRTARAAADAGDVRGALDLLAGAGDLDARARLLLERHRQWSGLGDQSVPIHADDALVHDPSLAELHLVRAWFAVMNDADLERATAFVEAVERQPLDGARAIRADSEIEFLRALLARRAGRLVDSAEHARAGVEIGELLDAASIERLSEWPYGAVVPTTAPLYLGHCLFHAGETGAARHELLRANASRRWSTPALAALHGVLALIGWLDDDPSGRIHAAIAASNLGDDLNANNHLAAVALVLTSPGPDADELADRYVEAAPRIAEPTAEIFGHVVAARYGDDDEARRSIAAARRIVEVCEQPGVLSQALARATASLDASDGAPDLGAPLTDGERRVVRALRGDLTEREIAAELHLSHNTVRTYRRRAYRKLGVTSRSEAVARLAETEGDDA